MARFLLRDYLVLKIIRASGRAGAGWKTAVGLFQAQTHPCSSHESVLSRQTSASFIRSQSKTPLHEQVRMIVSFVHL
jgi:hypothetical protein